MLITLLSSLVLAYPSTMTTENPEPPITLINPDLHDMWCYHTDGTCDMWWKGHAQSQVTVDAGATPGQDEEVQSVYVEVHHRNASGIVCPDIDRIEALDASGSFVTIAEDIVLDCTQLCIESTCSSYTDNPNVVEYRALNNPYYWLGFDLPVQVQTSSLRLTFGGGGTHIVVSDVQPVISSVDDYEPPLDQWSADFAALGQHIYAVPAFEDNGPRTLPPGPAPMDSATHDVARDASIQVALAVPIHGAPSNRTVVTTPFLRTGNGAPLAGGVTTWELAEINALEPISDVVVPVAGATWSASEVGYVFLDIDVSANAMPGSYVGTVTVDLGNGDSRTMTLTIVVHPSVLPARDSLDFTVGDWLTLNGTYPSSFYGAPLDQLRTDYGSRQRVVYVDDTTGADLTDPANPVVQTTFDRIDDAVNGSSAPDAGRFFLLYLRGANNYVTEFGGDVCVYDSTGAVTDAWKSAYDNFAEQLATHMAGLGVPADRWAFYPFDEPGTGHYHSASSACPAGSMDGIDFLRLVAPILAPHGQVYADFGWGNPAAVDSDLDGNGLHDDLDRMMDIPDGQGGQVPVLWAPAMGGLAYNDSWIASFQAEFDPGDELWGYNGYGVGTTVPSHARRVHAWRAFELGMKGYGFWSMSDFHGDSAWDALDSSTPDFANVFFGQYDSGSQLADTSLPVEQDFFWSRRLFATQRSLDDYRLLRLVADEYDPAVDPAGCDPYVAAAAVADAREDHFLLEQTRKAMLVCADQL